LPHKSIREFALSDLIDRILFFGYFPVDIDLQAITKEDIKNLNEANQNRFAHIIYEHLQGCAVPDECTIKIIFGRNDYPLYKFTMNLGVYFDNGEVSIHYI